MAPPWLITLGLAINYHFTVDKIEKDVVATATVAVLGASNPAVVCNADVGKCDSILRQLQDADVVTTSWDLEGFSHTMNLMRRDILLKYDMILVLQQDADVLRLMKHHLRLINSQARFIIACVRQCTNVELDCCKKNDVRFLKKLWYYMRIYRIVFLTGSCPGYALTTDSLGNDDSQCMTKISVKDVHHLLGVFRREVRDMRGQTLRINMSPVADLKVSDSSSDGIPYDGVDATILRDFVKYLNFTPEVTPINGIKYALTFENGIMTAAAVNLTFGLTDTVFNGNFMYYLGGTPALLSRWYKEAALCVVVDKAGQVPKLIALITPFSQRFLWVSSATICVVGFILYGIRHCSLSRQQPQFFDSWAVATSFLLGAPIIYKRRSDSEQILLASCSLWAMVVLGTYQGTLRGTLTTPKDLPDIKTLEELSDKGYTVYVGSEQLLTIFSLSGNDKIKRLVDRTVLVYRAKDEQKSRPRTGFIARHGTFYRTVGSDKHIVPTCVRRSYLSFMLRVGSPVASALDDMLSRLTEGGIIHYYYVLEERKQGNSEKQFSGPRVLSAFTLADIQGAFVLLAIGLFFTTIVFMFEVFDSRSKNKKQLSK